eukprot:12921465-Prorocentrum_lima.AAC.1
MTHVPRDIRIMCHGDEFLVLGDEDGLSYVDKLLREKVHVQELRHSWLRSGRRPGVAHAQPEDPDSHYLSVYVCLHVASLGSAS